MVMMPIPHYCFAYPILLVQPTAGGSKSSVCDVFFLMNATGGVYFTVSPLLSFGANQEEKLKAKAR
jgi:hypothetical protein